MENTMCFQMEIYNLALQNGFEDKIKVGSLSVLKTLSTQKKKHPGKNVTLNLTVFYPQIDVYQPLGIRYYKGFKDIKT